MTVHVCDERKCQCKCKCESTLNCLSLIASGVMQKQGIPHRITASQCKPEETQAGKNEKKRYRLFTTEVIYVLAAAPKAVDYFLL